MNKEYKPEISVILPVFNGEDFIQESIVSILNQSFSNFELIIINDGSADRTEEIINSCEDKRIVYINNSINKGLIYSLNYGISISRGKYIARMDADDISNANRLELEYDFLERNVEYGVVGSYEEEFGGVKPRIVYKPITDNENKLYLLSRCNFSHTSVMFRKEIIDRYNLKYDSDYKHAEDYKLWVEMSPYTKYYNIPMTIVKHRYHDSNVSIKYSVIQSKNSERISVEYALINGLINQYEVSLYSFLINPIDKDLVSIDELVALIKKIIKRNIELRRFDKRNFITFINNKLYFSLLHLTNDYGFKVFKIFIKEVPFSWFDKSTYRILFKSLLKI